MILPVFVFLFFSSLVLCGDKTYFAPKLLPSKGVVALVAGTGVTFFLYYIYHFIFKKRIVRCCDDDACPVFHCNNIAPDDSRFKKEQRLTLLLFSDNPSLCLKHLDICLCLKELKNAESNINEYILKYLEMESIDINQRLSAALHFQEYLQWKENKVKIREKCSEALHQKTLNFDRFSLPSLFSLWSGQNNFLKYRNHHILKGLNQNSLYRLCNLLIEHYPTSLDLVKDNYALFVVFHYLCRCEKRFDEAYQLFLRYKVFFLKEICCVDSCDSLTVCFEPLLNYVKESPEQFRELCESLLKASCKNGHVEKFLFFEYPSAMIMLFENKTFFKLDDRRKDAFLKENLANFKEMFRLMDDDTVKEFLKLFVAWIHFSPGIFDKTPRFHHRRGAYALNQFIMWFLQDNRHELVKHCVTEHLYTIMQKTLCYDLSKYDLRKTENDFLYHLGKFFNQLLKYFSDQGLHDDMRFLEELLEKNKLHYILINFHHKNLRIHEASDYFKKYVYSICVKDVKMACYDLDEEALKAICMYLANQITHKELADLVRYYCDYLQLHNYYHRLPKDLDFFIPYLGAVYLLDVYRHDVYDEEAKESQSYKSELFCSSLYVADKKKYKKFVKDRFFSPGQGLKRLRLAGKNYDFQFREIVRLDYDFCIKCNSNADTERRKYFFAALLKHELHQQAKTFVTTFGEDVIRDLIKLKPSWRNLILRVFPDSLLTYDPVTLLKNIASGSEIVSKEMVEQYIQPVLDHVIDEINWEDLIYHDAIKRLLQHVLYTQQNIVYFLFKLSKQKSLFGSHNPERLLLLSLQEEGVVLLRNELLHRLTDKDFFKKKLCEKLDIVRLICLVVTRRLEEEDILKNVLSCPHWTREDIWELVLDFSQSDGLENFLFLLWKAGCHWKNERIPYERNGNVLHVKRENRFALVQYGLTSDFDMRERWIKCEHDKTIGRDLLRYFNTDKIDDFARWSMVFDSIEKYKESHYTLLLKCLESIKENKQFNDLTSFRRAIHFFRFLIPYIPRKNIKSLIENSKDVKIKGSSTWSLFAGYWFRKVVDDLVHLLPSDTCAIYEQKKYLNLFFKEVPDVNWFVKKDHRTGHYMLYFHEDPTTATYIESNTESNEEPKKVYTLGHTIIRTFGESCEKETLQVLGKREWNELKLYDQAVPSFQNVYPTVASLL